MKRRKPGFNHNADINTSQNDLSSGHSAQSMVSGLNFRNFKMSWLVYGAAAYYGLKLLSRRGFLPTSTTQARDIVDRGVNAVKQQVGARKTESATTLNY